MFITLEGIEGSGKSTLIEILADYLRDQKLVPLVTREPGGSSLGRKLRQILLDPDSRNLSSKSELCLFMADRAQHVQEVIAPALEQGQIVLCDRYTDSTIAYQGYGRNMDIDELEKLCHFAGCDVVPDLTLLLDLPVRMGLGRVLQRKHEVGPVNREDRFDSETLDFHERVRQAYLELAKKYPERIKIIDAANGKEQVARDCVSALVQNKTYALSKGCSRD